MAATSANSRHISYFPLGNGATLFKSYKTVVGIAREGTLYLTTEKFSATTNRHMRKFASEFSGPVAYLTPGEFAILGHAVGTSTAFGGWVSSPTFG